MRGFLINIAKTLSFDKKQFKKIIALQGQNCEEIYRKKYLKNSNFIPPKLNEKWLEYLEKLNEDGLLVIENEFEDILKKIIDI